MLSDASATATLAVTDLEKAKEFYSTKLGFNAEEDEGGVYYKAGNGTGIYIYSRSNPPTSDNTQVSFKVEDIEKEMEELSAKGVKFEHYHLPEFGLKTDEKGLAVMGKVKSAWFKDPDGNILSLMQVE